MASKTKRTGRPSSYTEALGLEICGRIAIGQSLRKICAEKAMPDKTTILRWLAADATFRTQYALAREAQADAMLEEIIEIADDGTNDTYLDEKGNERTDQDVIARSRLRVDARKWAMSKMAPKKYGDKVDVGVDGSISITVRKLAADGHRDPE